MLKDEDLFGDLYPTYKHKRLDVDEFDYRDSPLIVNKPKEEPVHPATQFNNKPAGAHEVDRGVTVNWLSQALGMSRANVLTRLQNVPVLRLGPRNSKVYDFRKAVAHLVAPDIDVARYIKDLEPKDMPEQLRRPYWAARREEQKAREEAGDLWRSEDVLSVFAELFKLIKDKTTLWNNVIAQKTDLTREQRVIIDQEVRQLQDSLSDMVTKLHEGTLTPSQLSEFEDEEEDGSA